MAGCRLSEDVIGKSLINGPFSSTPCLITGGYAYLMGVVINQIQPISGSTLMGVPLPCLITGFGNYMKYAQHEPGWWFALLLKNISHLGWLFRYLENKKCSKPPTRKSSNFRNNLTLSRMFLGVGGGQIGKSWGKWRSPSHSFRSKSWNWVILCRNWVYNLWYFDRPCLDETYP